MNVKELIAVLRKFPEDAVVVAADGCENSICEVHSARAMTMVRAIRGSVYDLEGDFLEYRAGADPYWHGAFTTLSERPGPDVPVVLIGNYKEKEEER